MQFASEVSHVYDDKYLLAEFLACNTIAATMNVFEVLGLTSSHLKQCKEWAGNRSVSIGLKAEEYCKFLRKVVREVQSDTKSVSKSTVFGTSEHYTVTKVRPRHSRLADACT
jgi:hypothetical protein